MTKRIVQNPNWNGEDEFKKQTIDRTKRIETSQDKVMIRTQQEKDYYLKIMKAIDNQDLDGAMLASISYGYSCHFFRDDKKALVLVAKIMQLMLHQNDSPEEDSEVVDKFITQLDKLTRKVKESDE